MCKLLAEPGALPGKGCSTGHFLAEPPSPCPVPEGAQGQGTLRAQGSGHRGTVRAGQPRGWLPSSRRPRSPPLAFPRAADPARPPRLGGAARIDCPQEQPLGEGTTLPPKQPEGLKQKHSELKPSLFPRLFLPPAPAQRSLPQFRAGRQDHPILWADAGPCPCPASTASCPGCATESGRRQEGSECLFLLLERLARLWGAPWAAPRRQGPSAGNSCSCHKSQAGGMFPAGM